MSDFNGPAYEHYLRTSRDQATQEIVKLCASLDSLTQTCMAVAGERDEARAALAKAERERDSLARRCAVRFEETEKLRAERDALIEVRDAAVAYVAFAEAPAPNTRRDPAWQDERLRRWAALAFAVDSLQEAPQTALSARQGDQDAEVVAQDPNGATGVSGALDAAIEALERVGCQFEFCDGPTTEPVPMKTCYVCEALARCRAAAPFIPVSPSQRAEIEADALLRAGRDAIGQMGPHLYTTEQFALWLQLRARAASVNTEVRS